MKLGWRMGLDSTISATTSTLSADLDEGTDAELFVYFL